MNYLGIGPDQYGGIATRGLRSCRGGGEDFLGIALSSTVGLRGSSGRKDDFAEIDLPSPLRGLGRFMGIYPGSPLRSDPGLYAFAPLGLPD